MTHSENVFECISRDAGYDVERPVVRDREGVRTADLIVSGADFRLVAEVEELRPNRDDLRQIRSLRDGDPTGGGSTIGARPRRHIRAAARQLKPYAAQQIPLLIVLYDNVRVGNTRVAYPMFYLQPHDIDAAMYGDRTAYVPLRPNAIRRPDRNGGKRTCTSTERTYISAVAVISDWDDSTMIFYHNRFARVPLASPVFRGKNFYHFQKVPEEPWKWARFE